MHVWKMIVTFVFIQCGVFAESPSLIGSYAWCASENEKQVIAQAVEDGVAQIGCLLRSIARSRLTESTKPFKTLTFAELSGGRIQVVRDADNPIVAPTNGVAVAWTRSDGKVFQVQQFWTGTVLTQIYSDADANIRENAYTLALDGKGLTLAITIKSKRFKVPLRYALHYQRQ